MTKVTSFQKTLRRHKEKVLLSTANLKYKEFMQGVGCYIASLTILTEKDWCFTQCSTGMAGWLLLMFTQ